MASDRKHRLFELCGYAAYTEVLFRTWFVLYKIRI